MIPQPQLLSLAFACMQIGDDLSGASLADCVSPGDEITKPIALRPGMLVAVTQPILKGHGIPKPIGVVFEQADLFILACIKASVAI